MKFHNICILRLGAIGDVVHTLPLLNILKSSLKECRITYAMSPTLAPLLKYAKGIDRIFDFDLKKDIFGLMQTAKDLREFSEGKITDFINLQPNLKSHFLAWLTKPETAYNYKKSDDESMHVWQNFALTYFHPQDAVLQEFDINEHLPLIEIPGEIIMKNVVPLRLDPFKPILAFVPGVGKHRPHRAWPIKNWLQLIKILDQREDIQPEILLIGGPDETEICNKLEMKLSSFTKLKIHNLCGKYDLVETAAILSRANLVIGGDTGPTHLAAALGKTTIALFGPTSPFRHAPFTGIAIRAQDYDCSKGCSNKKCARKVLNCMDSLTPEQVWLAMGTNA